MNHRAFLLVGLLISAAAVGSPPALLHARQAAAPVVRAAAQLVVTLPHEDAALSVDGAIVVGSGSPRTVETQPLEPGRAHRITLSASWQPNTYTTMTRNRAVMVRAGEHAAVDLSSEDANDRVRVIYVPTPEDIAQEMARLAAITPADVVYEPGCGDGRITIAAVKAGAKRGICIDIDPDRVKESTEKVAEAGFADRIDVRLGDALDFQNLSDASVVFLYMGDHFNLLIRPTLWRGLKVGSRVVSHRFEMGDWQPDKTITVSSADGGGDYVLHLWTITEDIKRRVSASPQP